MRKHRVLWLVPLMSFLSLCLEITPSFCWEQGQYGYSTANSFGGTGELWQESGFYAKTLTWQFYDDDTNVVYKSSSDAGITWSSPTVWCASRASAYMCIFNLYYDEETNKVHTVYAAASPPLYYRRGTPSSDGTISWDAWQNVRNVADMQYSSPSICLDSDGYPWIASAEALDWENTQPAVTKSSTKDGTWTPEFWTLMTATVANWQCIILPLGDGNMYAMYVENNSGWVNTQYGKLWNGTTSTWGSEDTICDDSNASSFGATSDLDTHIYLTYHGYFIEYTVGSGWGSEIHLGFNYYGATLAIDLGLDELYRFGHHTDEIIYLQKRTAGVWGENVTVMDVGAELGYTEIYMGSWHEDSYGRIAVVFSRNPPDSSPYNHHLIMITIGNLYRFHGAYDEDTGLLKAADERAVSVTAYWDDGMDSDTFEVNGTEIKSFDTAPQYFRFDLQDEEDVVSQHDLNIFIYNGSNYYDILFPSYEDDTDYSVQVSLTWNSTYTVTDKSVTGCRVNFGTPPDVDEYLDWYVYRSTLSVSISREYWISPDEEPPLDIYIFDTTLSLFTVQFLDLASALDTYPFIEIKRYINGSLMIVEKRKADAQDKIAASLKSGEKYTLEIRNGASYTYGDVLFQSLYATAPTTVTLSLNPILFPQRVILAYRYVRPYAYRHTNLTSISILFEEVESISCSVEIDILFENLTSVGGIYPYTYGSTTNFNHTWSSANYSLTYVVQMEITHPTFNTLNYNTILARGFSSSPWNFDFIGTIPNLDTSSILPLCLIFGSLLIFSKVNAYMAGFVATCVAIMLTWFGWIYIPPIALMASMVLSILLALRYKKKRDIF